MDDQGQVVGSKLHQTMLRIDPSFNFRDLGYRTFGQYIESRDEVSISRATDTSDLIVHLRQSTGNGVKAADPGAPAPDWEMRIDDAWTSRDRPRISGQVAATDAARVLGSQRLKDSRYPSLDKLLGASEYLQRRWHRERNAIILR